jgi:hypothetical protein
MAGQLLSTLAEGLKKNYTGPVVDALNNQNALYSLLEKSEEDISGENLQAVVSLKTGRNQGVGSRAEDAALPTARYIKRQKLSIPLTHSYGAIRFTGQALKAGTKSPTAFGNLIQAEIDGMVESMKIDTNRQMFGQGDGHLCMTNGSGTTEAVVTVDKPGTTWLEEGMPIQSFADLSSPSMDSSDLSYGLTESTCYTVWNILSETTFTLGNAAWTAALTTEESWANDRYICRWGSAGNEMMGLRGIIADANVSTGSGSWLGLAELASIYYTGDGSTAAARATYPILNATINHNSGTNRAISEKLIQGLLDDIDKKAGKKSDNKSLVFVTNHAINRNFVDLLQADRRYVTKPLVLTGGWESLGYQSGSSFIPIIVDKMSLPNALLVLDRRFLKIYRASDYDWMEKDGSMFARVDNKDAYTAQMYCYQNLGCTSFRNQGALRDLTE